MSIHAIGAVGAVPCSRFSRPTEGVQPARLLGVDRASRHRHGFRRGQEITLPAGFYWDARCYGGQTAKVTGFTASAVVLEVSGDGTDMMIHEITVLVSSLSGLA